MTTLKRRKSPQPTPTRPMQKRPKRIERIVMVTTVEKVRMPNQL